MSVKGFTYEISKEEGIFSFAADAGENTNVWFKKYSTPSAFESEESEFGSSWSWMGQPGAIESPNNGSLNPETGCNIVVHTIPDGTETGNNFSLGGNSVRGVTWEGQYFWVSDIDNSQLKKVDVNGNVKQTNSYSPQTVRGLSWDGEYLWATDNSSGVIYQLKTNGSEVTSFSSFGANNTGIAFDGTYLWSGDLNSGAIYKHTTGGNKVKTVNPPDLSGTRGFTHDGVYLWVSDGGSGAIYQLKEDGTTVSKFLPSGKDLLRPAWTGSYVWANGFPSEHLYQFTSSTSIDVSYRVSSVT